MSDGQVELTTTERLCFLADAVSGLAELIDSDEADEDSFANLASYVEDLNRVAIEFFAEYGFDFLLDITGPQESKS
jgi:hypothetical protein